jgi:ribose transport system ATP-binding protein
MTLAAQPVARGSAAAVSIKGLRKTFPGQVALAGVDLTVSPGEVHALLGENGSGKSTLIKVLSGFYKPDPGAAVEINGESLPFGHPGSAHRLGARFVHQDLGLVPALSIADNLYLGSRFPNALGTIRSNALRAATREALAVAGLDLDPDLPVTALSPAQRTGVAVARALRSEPDQPVHLLVLDEPTATLPDNEVHRLLATVRAVAGRGIGVIYVTHRIDEIFEIANRVTVLRDGAIAAQREVAGLTRAELVTLLVGDEFEAIERASAKVDTETGDVVLTIRDLTTERIHGISLDISTHCVTGIAGITGSGRENILAAIFGAADRDGGEVVVAGRTLSRLSPRQAIRAGTAFVPADRKTHAGILTLTARENLTLADLRPARRGLTLLRSRESADTRRWFDRLLIRPRDGAELPLAKFSGGNQQKVLLAKWLRRNPQLLLIDEPTQGVDLAAKAEIHTQLLGTAQAGASVVVACSDPDELAALCQRVLVLRRGHVAADLTGPDITAERISRLSHDDGKDH